MSTKTEKTNRFEFTYDALQAFANDRSRGSRCYDTIEKTLTGKRSSSTGGILLTLKYTNRMGIEKRKELGAIYPTGSKKANTLLKAFRTIVGRTLDDAMTGADIKKEEEAAEREREENIPLYMEYLHFTYKNHLKSLNKKTRNYNSDINCLINKFEKLHEIKLNQIEPRLIKDWMRKESLNGLSRDTIIKNYGRFSACMKYAVNNEIIDENPLKDFDSSAFMRTERIGLHKQIENQKKTERSRRLLTDREKAAFFKMLDDHENNKRDERRRSRKHSNRRHLLDLAAFFKVVVA